MTNEELTLRIAAGELNLSTELWLQIEGYIRWQASRFLCLYEERCKAMVIDVDDLCQVGYFAMLKAIEKYDPSRETKFTTLLAHCLKSQFFRLAKMSHAGWEKNMVYACRSLSEPISEDGDITLGDSIATNDPGLAEVERTIYQESAKDVLVKSFEALTNRQEEVITALFFGQQTYAVVSQCLGISRGAVQVIKESGFKKLRKDVGLLAFSKTD